MCDFIPQCPNGIDESLCRPKCSFEDNTCLWEEDDNVEMDFHWIIGSGEQESRFKHDSVKV